MRQRKLEDFHPVGRLALCRHLESAVPEANVASRTESFYTRLPMILMQAQITKTCGHKSGVTHTATLPCKHLDSVVCPSPFRSIFVCKLMTWRI